MKLAVAIPMKPFSLAKQRLRPDLDAVTRQELATMMLAHVLAAVAASGVIAIRGIVSADPAVLGLAAQYGFEPIAEPEPRGYNAAAARARAWAQARGADALLILPADLPLLSPSDIFNLARLAAPHQRVLIIAPDAAESGTNALLLRPPQAMSCHFGPHSFEWHQRLAQKAGLPFFIYRSTTIARDIDWPEDLSQLSGSFRESSHVRSHPL